MRSGGKESFKDEFLGFLRESAERELPQRKLERALVELLRACARRDPGLSEEEVAERASSIRTVISLALDRAAMDEGLWGIFEDLPDGSEGPAGTSARLVEEIYEYLADNLDKSISFDAIARKFKVSPSYLTRAFRKTRKETPIKCLIGLRIGKAKTLMSERPDLDIKDIAAVVGYDDQHYFSRIFKSVVGLSPSDFRRSAAGGG
jgi:AraC-like DNA-binding protein